MASHNKFHGYVCIPKQKTYRGKVRLDFNAQLESEDEKGTKMHGFALRLFVLGKKPGAIHPEIGVTLRPEEWLDLIDAMKQEFEVAEKWRKKLDSENS